MKITVEDLINKTDAKLLNGKKNIIIKDCFIDSRKVTPNSCFFGIIGNKTDGSLYYKKAINNGANVLVLSKRKDYDFTGHENITVLIAEDTTKVLQDLAKYKRSLFKGPVVAITGSVGKTSTKEIIYNVLSQKYKVLKTIGNQNSQLGLPLTILKLKDEDAMVLEMGMSNLGNIHNLSLIAKPDISVITNVYSSHIKYLKTEENILKAKLEIIDGMNSDGYLIINNDNKYLRSINIDKKINVLTFGINNNSNVMPNNIVNNDNISSFSIYDINDLNINGPKEFIYNVLPSYIVGKLLGLSRSMIKNGINKSININHRLNVINLNNNVTIIDDTYNASYESVKTALDYMKTFSKRKVLVLGDILELGNKSKKIHKKVGELVKSYNIDILITIGKYTKYVGKNNKDIWIKHFKSENKSESFIKSLIKDNDAILIKGSNDINLVNIVNYLKKD